jgi:hypothetical protein
MVHFAWVYPNKKICTKWRRVMHNDHYWFQIHFNMFCLFIWLNKEIKLCRMNFTSILVITEVIFEFYWEKILCKGTSLQVRAGSGWTKVESGRAGLNKSWAAWGRGEPQKSGSLRALSPRVLIVGISSSSRFIKIIFRCCLDEIRISTSPGRI